ncbi:MAG: hypothetical protein KBT00_03125 [Bacteroidales bacterium]|nr:hypothetical protein [Candidatus Cacconaster merdequi]
MTIKVDAKNMTGEISSTMNIAAAEKAVYRVTELIYTPLRTTVNSGEELSIPKVTAVWSNGIDSYTDSEYTNFSISIGNAKANSTLNGDTIYFNTDNTTGGTTTIRITSKDNTDVSITIKFSVRFMNV